MTDEERWEEIEECFDAIKMDIENRCYSSHSNIGARYIALLTRRHLIRMDELLLEDMERA